MATGKDPVRAPGPKAFSATNATFRGTPGNSWHGICSSTATRCVACASSFLLPFSHSLPRTQPPSFPHLPSCLNSSSHIHPQPSHGMARGCQIAIGIAIGIGGPGNPISITDSDLDWAQARHGTLKMQNGSMPGLAGPRLSAQAKRGFSAPCGMVVGRNHLLS